MVELNPVEGTLTNAVGTRNVADAALRHQVLAMVQISTDKAVNPDQHHGRDQAAGRILHPGARPRCRWRASGQADRTRFMTVRFGNVLGS